MVRPVHLLQAGGLLVCLAPFVGCAPMPGDPVLSLSPAALTFQAVEGEGNPAVQTVTVRNSGGGTLAWTATSDADWLTLAPADGMTMAQTSVTVTADISMLGAAASPYSATITFSDNNTTTTDETIDVTLVLAPGMCTELSGTISSSMTLSGCYDVTGNVTVSGGATLTLAPGTTLTFAQNAGLRINNDGRLAASGTQADPIRLTGAEAVPGFWTGLSFVSSNSMINRLDYVTVEYGGGNLLGNVYVDGTGTTPSRVSITNSTFSESSHYGMYWDADAIIEEFSNNTMTSNGMGAASVVSEMVGSLGSTSTFSGNDTDIVQLRGGTVSTNQTWPGIDVPYHVTSSITATANVTIAAGAEFVFNQALAFTVRDDGALAANGTMAEPILMTGDDPTRGFWSGLHFLRSNSTTNVLSYVTIEYAGGNAVGNLYVDGTGTTASRLRVDNCTFRESSAFGFYWDADVLIEQFSNVQSTANELGAGSCASEHVGLIEDSGTYSGNTRDVIEMRGGNVSTDQTWRRHDVPYYADGSATVGAALSIAPGVEITFAQGVGLNIQDAGSLSALGTEIDPILFTGDDPTPGYWAGVQIFRSISESNRLEYVTIEYGGGVYDGNLDVDGTGTSNSRVDVSNCTFRESGSYGIYLDADTLYNADIDTVNTFANNTDGDVRFP